jgi:glycosyltransferase involved in cell wall biosynthesis
LKKLLYIGNKLSKHGFNKTTVEIVSELLKHEGFEVTTASDKKNFVLRVLDMLFTISKKATKTDYIIIDTYSTKAFWYAILCSQLARFLNIKYIPILHGGNLPNRLTKNPKLCQLVFKNAYYNIAPSNYLKETFEKVGFTNVIYIPNSIEITNYPFKNRNIFLPNLLWVRAFAAIYNPKMAIDVLAIIKQQYPEATLTMVGPDKDGSLVTTKKYADSLGLKVNFTGKLSKKEWIKLAEKHTIFINTTHFDNTPVSVIEAMALGLPVLSTNVGGIPFLITHNENGFLVNDNDTMANEIMQIIDNSERAIAVVNSAKSLVNSFDWEVVKEKWVSILK